MAEDKAISPQVQKISVPEAQALADRLYARSQSSLFVGSPEVRRDLCLASRTIRHLIGVVDTLADRCNDEAYKLRTLRIDVSGC